MTESAVALIAMDMDGTLLDSHQRLTPGNLKALREAQNAGIRLAICSGRLPGDVAMFLDEAGLPECAILSLNGSYCLERFMEGAFFNRTLDGETLNATVEILCRARFPFGCFAQNRLAIFEGDFPVEGRVLGHVYPRPFCAAVSLRHGGALCPESAGCEQAAVHGAG